MWNAHGHHTVHKPDG